MTDSVGAMVAAEATVGAATAAVVTAAVVMAVDAVIKKFKSNSSHISQQQRAYTTIIMLISDINCSLLHQ